MNTYSTDFFATCPTNGARIRYSLTIRTESVVMVEEILDTLAEFTSGYHEHIANELHQRLGGQQRLVADHHSVTIETERP